MKFFLPIVLFAIAGVSAQDKNCRANYIVDRCLSTETPKVRKQLRLHLQDRFP